MEVLESEVSHYPFPKIECGTSSLCKIFTDSRSY